MKDSSEIKNDCGKKDLLMAYLYNEASSGERHQFEQHLLACDSCHHELQAFGAVREDLKSWQIPFVPPIEVVTPRQAVDVWREFFRLIPGWFKIVSGLTATAAAAVVLLALSSTRISLGNGGFDAHFGIRETVVAAPAQTALLIPAPTPQSADFISRSEAEKMIQLAVAEAQTKANQQTQAQLANLSARLAAEHQLQLKNATMKLDQKHQKNMKALMAEGNRQTLTEWLFASSDGGAENQEQKENEKNQ